MTSPLGTQTFSPGQIIADKYELVRLIGEGGMGAVFEARHRSTYKRCAAKVVLNPELMRNAELVHRFFREAQASSVVESEHIVQVFDSGFDQATGCPYMVMELLEGEDLDATLRRLGAMNPIAAAKLVLQASMGLARAHDKGIVHRDIKPANLFLSRRESGELQVKLLDFGIAKVKLEGFSNQGPGAHGLTRTGSMLGTPLYMSPEQAKGASRVDARADVWSLGVALYQFLAGRLPFDLPESLGELMVNIITGDLTMLQDVAPWVAPELAEITHRAISRDLEQRYQNAGELRDALTALLPDGPTLVPELLTSVPADQRSVIAPRLELTDDGILRARTRTGLAVSQVPPRRAGESRTKALVVGGTAVAFAVLGGIAVTLLWARAHAETPEPVALIAESELTPVASAKADDQTFSLTIDPPDATVEVEGTATQTHEGRVTISGPLGATRRVVVRQGDRSVEQLVAIASSGLVPDKVVLPTPAASAVAPAPTVRPAVTGGPAATKPVKQDTTGTPPQPGVPKLADDTSEFN